MKLLPSTLSIAILLALMPAVADDGEMLKRNVSKTPALETEHAAFRMLPVYVPAQSSDGLLVDGGIDYLDAEGAVADTREYVRPLISYFTDGHVEYIDEEGYGGFPGHGERDALAAVSLDDGSTWKRTNLSKSANLSSFSIKLGKRKKTAYPGDVGRSFLASDGNKALAVWASRYCSSGNPAYAMDPDTEQLALADYLAGTGTIENADACTDLDLTTPCTYLEDSFAVSGSQGSSDLADEGLPLIGVLPYACVWTARGSIQPPTEEGMPSTFTWFKAERLTSGRRDANRPEASCVKGAGCVVTWQEDPDGIRPGEGEGPGEGWSGAIAHHQTDIWYSYIDWDDFDLVADDAEPDTAEYGTFYNDTGILADWLLTHDEGSPKAAVPMSIPMRITDNSMCTALDVDNINDSNKPFCYIDYDASGTADFCASTVAVSVENPNGTQELEMCVTEDGRLMRGNTASTRARVRLHGYSSLGVYDPANPDAFPVDSGWFSTSYEENKGLGECEDEDEVFKLDMGKNVWYHTFDMFLPELVSQGLMLNQPAVYPDDWSDTSGVLTQDGSLGYNFYQITEDPIYETLAGLESTLFQSEISRRPSPITQDWYTAGETGTVAFQLWKQGVLRRGGPADIFGRRFVLPDDFDATTDNPYAYENMHCETWAFADGSNPRYVKGFCADPAVNISANTILEGECGDTTACQEAFVFTDYFDDLEGGTQIQKIWTWQQFGAGYGEAPPDNNNLDDTSWENPYDVAKGHRGFLLGDMVMAMYAWSPNWLANTVGHDNYNLYNRRSFDGGQTWSTTPGDLDGNGTTTCEYMGPAGSETEYPVCTTYAAGDFEQARNVSQLVGNKVTILDPRYSPATPSITAASVSTASLPAGFAAPEYFDDTRDPSRYFMVYETGDNTTVAVGEAEPLDLFYSRAVDYGDDYLVWADEVDATCLPSAEDAELAGFCNEFDALEGKKDSESGEASITTNPGATFFYALWNQVDFMDSGDESDAWFRRVWFIDDYVPGEDPDPEEPVCTDADGDGYCVEDVPADCDDDDPTINPGARDRGGKRADGIDNDCNGIIDG